MRTVIALLLLTAAASAQQFDNFTFKGDPIIEARPCQDEFKELPALADRFGVKPIVADGSFHSLLFRMCDGRIYDTFDLINAFLDKMERNAK